MKILRIFFSNNQRWLDHRIQTRPMQNQTLAQAEREMSVYTGRKPLGHTKKVRAKDQNLNQWGIPTFL